MSALICDGCHAAPAVVYVTARQADGRYEGHHFCEPCHSALSDERLTELIRLAEHARESNRLDHDMPPLLVGLHEFLFRPADAEASTGPRRVSDMVLLILQHLTEGLSPADARDIAETTVREVVNRGARIRAADGLRS